jgi:acetyltransferase-like isoleucine patch superfamily enzyme
LCIGRGSRIYPSSIVASGRGISLGESVEIGDGSILNAFDGKISIGNHSAIGPYVTIYGMGQVTIGDYAAIAAHSTVVAANHNFGDRNRPIRLQGSTGKGILIEDDVWVGSHSVILDGVKVGRGSVVAAGAVVNLDVAPYTVVGGVPAEFMRARGFDCDEE